MSEREIVLVDEVTPDNGMTLRLHGGHFLDRICCRPQCLRETSKCLDADLGSGDTFVDWIDGVIRVVVGFDMSTLLGRDDVRRWHVDLDTRGEAGAKVRRDRVQAPTRKFIAIYTASVSVITQLLVV